MPVGPDSHPALCDGIHSAGRLSALVSELAVVAHAVGGGREQSARFPWSLGMHSGPGEKARFLLRHPNGVYGLHVRGWNDLCVEAFPPDIVR